MSAVQNVLDFFQTQSVVAAFTFLGEYAVGKALDNIIRKSNEDLDSSELISKQLYEALNESLKITCKHLKHIIFEYDDTAIKDTFTLNDNPWIAINSQEKLVSILKNAIGLDSFNLLNTSDILYWFYAFNTAVSNRTALYNFLNMQETPKTTIPQPSYGWVYESPERISFPDKFPAKNIFIGDLIANRYRVMDKLGAGGYGSVLLVYDCHLRRDAAMKVFFSDPESAKNELNILNGLKHPGLPYIYDILPLSQDKTAIVMDLIKGPTLMQEAFSLHGLSVPRTIDITKRLCSIVSYLHKLNIIHGDIKPNNIILEDENVVLIDYNLAQFLNTSTFPLGRTDGYSPPEFYKDKEWERIQFIPSTSIAVPMLLDNETYWVSRSSDSINNILSVRSDIYSIGATVYYSVTGRHPWPFEEAECTIQMMEKEDSTIYQILNGCLQKDPHNRFSSVHEILDIIG